MQRNNQPQSQQQQQQQQQTQQQYQQQQQQNAQQPEEILDSIFAENYSLSQLWLPLPENMMQNDSEVIHQGRLFTKNSRSKKQHFFHFELYSNIMIRVDEQDENTVNEDAICLEENNNNNNNRIKSHSRQYTNSNSIQQNDNSEKGSIGKRLSTKKLTNNNTMQDSSNQIQHGKKYYLDISSCFLKKIRYNDHQVSNYKFGIRLQRKDLKCELFTESAEDFNKWYEEIKRFCVLGKFNKKYKILTKMKNSQYDYFQQYRGFRFSDSNQVCIRIIDKYQLQQNEKQHFLKEASILRRINHPLMIKLNEIYEDEANIFAVYDLVQSKSLKSKLKECVCFDERVVSDIVWKLLHALTHLHSKNIIHRNIRLNTIYYKNSNNLGDICLGSFKNATTLPQSNSIQSNSQLNGSFNNNEDQLQVENNIGVPGYKAPELYNMDGKYNQKVDIFALGCVFYALIFGVPPFQGENDEQTEAQNKECKLNLNLPPPFFKLSTSCKDLLQKMLEKNPLKRPNAQQMMNHTWFINIRSKGVYDQRKTNFMGLSSLSTIKENMSELETHVIQSKLHNNNTNNMNGNFPSLNNMPSLSNNDPYSYMKGQTYGTSIMHMQQFAEQEINEDEDDDPYSPRQKIKMEFEYESLSDKMGTLNNGAQIKPPSKQFHDNCTSLLRYTESQIRQQ